MTRDDLYLLAQFGFTGNERKVRASLQATALGLCMAGGLLLAKQLGWWPKEPALWLALGMLAAGIAAFMLARKPSL